jgi:hypothetical protein
MRVNVSPDALDVIVTTEAGVEAGRYRVAAKR